MKYMIILILALNYVIAEPSVLKPCPDEDCMKSKLPYLLKYYVYKSPAVKPNLTGAENIVKFQTITGTKWIQRVLDEKYHPKNEIKNTYTKDEYEKIDVMRSTWVSSEKSFTAFQTRSSIILSVGLDENLETERGVIDIEKYKKIILDILAKKDYKVNNIFEQIEINGLSVHLEESLFQNGTIFTNPEGEKVKLFGSIFEFNPDDIDSTSDIKPPLDGHPYSQFWFKNIFWCITNKNLLIYIYKGDGMGRHVGFYKPSDQSWFSE